MRRRSCVGGLVLGLIVAAGCASDGGSAQPRYANPTGALISANAAVDLDYRPRWTTSLGLDAGERIVAVNVLDDLLITITQPGSLVAATTLRDGNTIWVKNLGGRLERLYGATRYDGSIYVNSGERIFEVDPYSGEHLGTAPIARPVTSGPSLREDLAIFGAVNGSVVAHSFITGRERWQYLMTARINTPPQLVGTGVFATDDKGTYAMLDASSGNLQWVGRTFGTIVAAPAIDRASIYIPSRDTFLYAINRATGEDKWKFPAAQPLTRAPVAIDQTVYQPLDGKLVALNAADGQPRWTLDEQATPIVARGGNVLASTGKSLLLINADTGRVAQRVPTTNVQLVIPGPDDSLILVGPGGKLMRLDPA